MKWEMDLKYVLDDNFQTKWLSPEQETKVRNQGEISLITTIPKTYVKALDIESGDTIEWTLNTETETLELKIVK